MTRRAIVGGMPLAGVLSLVLLLATPDAGAATESPWASLLRNDVAAMRRTLLDSHPGPVDQQNGAFRSWLEKGHGQALERAKTCDSFEGYWFALKAYAEGFNDGHLSVHAGLERTGSQWAGFLVGRERGRFVVRTVDDRGERAALPAVGDEVVSCDGVSVKQRLEREVFPFVGNPALEREWDKAAPLLFVDERNPWRGALPRSCLFRGTAGATTTRPITWRRIGRGDLEARLATARQEPALEFSVRPFGARGVWVTLPTFNTKNERAVERLKEMVKQSPSWRDRDPIVFDVRTNGGGSSSWGHQMLNGMYGADFVRARLMPLAAKQFVEWRVSEGNVAHVEGMVAQVTRERGAEATAGIRAIAAGMREAHAAGRSLWRAERPPAQPLPPVANPVRGKVFLLTDGNCGSACLDFADMVLGMPNTVHVGRVTYADSVYMENRYVWLPSGVVQLGFATKVYRNRPRANNQPLVPRYRFDGDMADGAALERWIAELAAH